MQKLTIFGRVAAIVAISVTVFFTKGTIADVSNEAQTVPSLFSWQGLHDYQLPLTFTPHICRKIDDLDIELHAEGLVLAQDKRHIDKINPGGYLFVASDNGQGKITLTLSADNEGHLVYEYRINDLLIHSQRSAELFLTRVLHRLDETGQQRAG